MKAHHFIPGPLTEPPANVEAEQMLLGTLLTDARRFELITDILEPEHFFDPVCQRVFTDIARRVKAGQVADVVTLRNHYRAAGITAEVGGDDYLPGLLGAAMHYTNLRPYAEVIKDCWRRRQVIAVAEDAIAAPTSVIMTIPGRRSPATSQESC